MVQIPHYPKYSIDRTGQVRSNRGRIKPAIGFMGHQVVTLYGNNKKRKKLFVYLVMAEVYLGYRPGTGDVVRHIDGDLSNNSLDNLKITSRHEVSLETRVSELPVGITYSKGLYKASAWHNDKRVIIGTYRSLRRAILKKQQYEERFDIR